MSDSSVLEKFFELAAEAERIDSAMEESTEQALEAVLTHVLENPGSRKLFADAFIKIARDPTLGPGELVEYCMHALRWPEVKAALEADLDSEKSERIRQWLRQMIMAFDDDWLEARFYDRFRSSAAGSHLEI